MNCCNDSSRSEVLQPLANYTLWRFCEFSDRNIFESQDKLLQWLLSRYNILLRKKTFFLLFLITKFKVYQLYLIFWDPKSSKASPNSYLHGQLDAFIVSYKMSQRKVINLSLLFYKLINLKRLFSTTNRMKEGRWSTRGMINRDVIIHGWCSIRSAGLSREWTINRDDNNYATFF
jgi:hypothetical protein